MNRITSILIIALLLASLALWSAEPATTKPAAQAAAAYSWNPIIPDGSVIGNRHFDRSTRYKSRIVVSEDGTVIAGAEFPDPARVGITGLYNLSASQVIVEEGQTINGGLIEHLIDSGPADVQIDSSSGIVAFRASFSGAGCAGGGVCNGLFFRYRNGERKLIATEMNTVNGSGVYLLLRGGKIAASPGMWAAPAITATTGNADSRVEGKTKKTLETIGDHIGGTFGGVIRGPKGWWGTVNTNTASKKQEGQQTVPQRGQVNTPTAFRPEPMPGQPNCAAPPTFPLAWSDLGSAAGPIAFVRADSGGFPAARYVPQGRPPAQGPWGRRVYFTSACTPVAIALWDSSGKGTLEIVTPVGRVLFLNEDNGKYRLSGVEDVEPPAPGTPIDSLMHITRKGCDVLLPVAFAKGGKAILRGTPVSMANCPQD